MNIGIGMTSQRTRARMLERLREQGIQDAMVLAAMNSMPRHPFVEEALQSRAYEDTPLPIGQGQTISSPYTVARSCELACQGRILDRVLEIGGGCGYQAAVLSKLAKEVVSVERIAKLVGRARLTLRGLRINNVLMKNADGSHGYPEAAPFDAIIITCAPEKVPPPLVEQLRDGGRMIVPVGPIGDQELVLLCKRGEQLEQHAVLSVRFVPMTGGAQR